MINGFVPAAMASEFDIDGNVNLDRLTIVLSDSAPEGAVNHSTDSRVVARESEYLCAQMASHFTAMSNEESVDFEPVAVFDVHVTPWWVGCTAETYCGGLRNSDILLPIFLVTPNHDSDKERE